MENRLHGGFGNDPLDKTRYQSGYMLCRSSSIVFLFDSTLFRLLHGKSCHLPVEFNHKAHWAIQLVNFDYLRVGKQRLLQLNELDEWCLQV